ncbi:MAG: hypothetical protein ACE5JM_06330 [Armatimonadota bacterium]
MPAWEHLKRVLFSPFNLRKWLILALVAFLAGVMQSGGGGGGGNFGGPPGGPGGDFEDFAEGVADWARAHTDELIAGGTALVVVGIGFTLLMLYVSSIFRFIFLESVITNEVRIRDSWGSNKAEGISYMWWRIGFGLLVLLVPAIFVGLPIAAAVWPLVGARGSAAANPGPILFAMVYGIGMIFVVAVVGGLISGMTRDFVLPIMYLRRIGALDGWRRFWPILCGKKKGFAIYFLLKIAFAIAAGIAAGIGGCLGIVVAAIPLAAIGALGYGLVLLLGITAWEWWFLAVLIPVGFVLLLLLSYWMNCVLLPIPVYFQAYALKYLGFAEPELETI